MYREIVVILHTIFNINNFYFIRRENMDKRLTLFLACLLMSLRVAFAQVDVSGTVISQDDGEPVIGASVVIFGGG